MEMSAESLLPAPAGAGRFQAGPVDVRTERILRIQGYRDMERVRKPIRRAADKAAGIAREIAEGEVGFRRVGIAACSGANLELEGGERFECAAFERFLTDCESVVVFAMTAGAAIDQRIDDLMADDDPVVALLLDTAGWLAIESITRQFSERLKADCGPAGLRLTRRMGPGYTYRMGREMAPWGTRGAGGSVQGARWGCLPGRRAPKRRDASEDVTFGTLRTASRGFGRDSELMADRRAGHRSRAREMSAPGADESPGSRLRGQHETGADRTRIESAVRR